MAPTSPTSGDANFLAEGSRSTVKPIERAASYRGDWRKGREEVHIVVILTLMAVLLSLPTGAGAV